MPFTARTNGRKAIIISPPPDPLLARNASKTTSNLLEAVPRPCITISALAQAKVRWSVELTDDECCWWGELAQTAEGLQLADVHLARHQASPCYTVPDMDHYADLVADLHAERGLEPWQLSCWLHTHPTGCNRPSGVDERTFEEHFGQYRLALMLIVTHDHQWYGELSACQAPWPGLAAVRGQSTVSFAFESVESQLDPATAVLLEHTYRELFTPLPPMISGVRQYDLLDELADSHYAPNQVWFDDDDSWDRPWSTTRLIGFRPPSDHECLGYLDSCGWGSGLAREADVLDLELIAAHFGDDAMLIAEAITIRDRLARLMASGTLYDAF